MTSSTEPLKNLDSVSVEPAVLDDILIDGKTPYRKVLKTLIQNDDLIAQRVDCHIEAIPCKQEIRQHSEYSYSHGGTESDKHMEMKLSVAKYLEKIGYELERTGFDGEYLYKNLERESCYGFSDFRHGSIYVECGDFDSNRFAEAFGLGEIRHNFRRGGRSHKEILVKKNTNVEHLLLVPHDCYNDGRFTMYIFKKNSPEFTELSRWTAIEKKIDDYENSEYKGIFNELDGESSIDIDKKIEKELLRAGVRDIRTIAYNSMDTLESKTSLSHHTLISIMIAAETMTGFRGSQDSVHICPVEEPNRIHHKPCWAYQSDFGGWKGLRKDLYVIQFKNFIGDINGVGTKTIGKIWEHFGSVEKLYHADKSEIVKIPQVNETIYEEIRERLEHRLLDEMKTKKGIFYYDEGEQIRIS